MKGRILMGTLCLLASLGWSQQVTIVNHYGDTTGLSPDAQFLLDHSDHHTLVVNYFKPAASEDANRLETLVSGAVRLYLDEMVVVDREKVRFRKKGKAVLKDLNTIVRDAVKFYHFKALHRFPGFSDDVNRQVLGLKELDLGRFSGKPGHGIATRETMKRYWVEQHVDEVMALVNKEVGLFSNQNLLVVGQQMHTTLTDSDRERLLHEVETFETHDPLHPIEFELSQRSVELMASRDEFFLPSLDDLEEVEEAEDFASRILSLLETNNDQLSTLQQEVNALKKQRMSETDKALQSQINELRALVVQLSGGPIEDSVSEDLGIANLPGDVTIQYESGQSDLNGAGTFVVSEVMDLLARNPQLKVMITGYADKSGNPEANARIADQRAQEIRETLMSRGINKDRLIINHFGDLKSAGENPDDRKVVITFLLRP